jgi:antitoxin ParD1/3/4
LTKQNEKWISFQLEKENYSNIDELINDLVDQKRHFSIEINFVRQKLDEAEKSGFTEESAEEILAHSKAIFYQ